MAGQSNEGRHEHAADPSGRTLPSPVDGATLDPSGGSTIRPGALGETLQAPPLETLLARASRDADEWPPESIGARHLRVVDPRSYTVESEVAKGGIGRTLRAHDTHLDRPVALKELITRDASTEERFVREARITARLQHPSIVPLYEAGVWPSGEPFFAMKLVSGRSFDRVLEDATTLDQRLALLTHVLAVAEAMAYAHNERLIHRDLKPQNILLGPFAETVVIDWGLAKDLDEESSEPPPLPRLRPIVLPRPARPDPWRSRSSASSWAHPRTCRPSRPPGAAWTSAPTCMRSAPFCITSSREGRPTTENGRWISSAACSVIRPSPSRSSSPGCRAIS